MTWRISMPPTVAAAPLLGCAIALLAMGTLLCDAERSCADDPPAPTAMAGVGAHDARPLPRIGLFRLVPETFQFPDGYAIDPGRDPSRFAKPVDRDLIGEFALFSDRARHMTFSAEYRQESTRIAPGSDLIQLRFEWRF